MPTAHEFDDDYQPLHRPARHRGLGRRQRAFLVVVGVLVALALVGVGIGRAVVVRQWEEDSRARSERDRRQMARMVDDYERRNATAVGISRAEFEGRVVGQTAEGVREEVGPPDEVAGEGVAWAATYIRRTIHPATGRLDPQAVVHFEDARAVSVSYP